MRLNSLRGRLIALTLLVETIMISAMVFNSQRIAQEHLTRQFETRRAEMSLLLRGALAPSLAQRDYAEISEILRDAQQLHGLSYLVLFDHGGIRIASASSRPLTGRTPPEVAQSLQQHPTPGGRLDFKVDIDLGGQRLGQLLIGLELGFMNAAQRELLLQNIILGLAGILVTTLILAAIALWLTRRLALLSAASDALAAGDTFRPLPVEGSDDLGRLVAAFNRMGNALDNRVRELQAAEQTQRELADRLLFLAERDPLTTLANRARFDMELEHSLRRLQRDPNSRGALLYFDLDEFKTINDTYGHRAGDTVLLRTAESIGRLVRENELLARLGGDEFVILAPGADQPAAEALAERIITAISSEAFDFADRRLGLTASLGIALYPEHGSNPETLVSHADAAMYQAKASGKNCWRIYRAELDNSEHMLHQLGWNESIQRALEENRLLLHFQGIHDCRTGAVAHYEALVRMRHPGDPHQLLMPGSFIPAAERSGRIVDIDRWVIGEAIRTLADKPWLSELAINVSARSFEQPGLTTLIRSLLDKHGVAAHRLIIELTETSALGNMHDAEQFIHHIHQLGCTVCLDDFGVGFSSFAYLKQLSADVLKIDGMFIRNLPNDPQDQVFVQAIVEIARGLGKKTVAEFVGDAATLAILRQLGVDYVQGYYLSRPQAEISAS